jgi:hypothetical protein
MTAKLLSATDFLFSIVFTALKKVMWAVLITAVIASFVTAILVILGYNIVT